MAEFTLEPKPTSKELEHAARLVRDRKGSRSLEHVAREAGLATSELSRFLHAKLERKWGYSRLRKIADWAGVSIDGLLGRPEGQTKVLEAGGRTPRLVPTGERFREDLFRIVDELAREKIRLRFDLVTVLRKIASEEEDRNSAADEILRIVDGYVERVTTLRDSIKTL